MAVVMGGIMAAAAFAATENGRNERTRNEASDTDTVIPLTQSEQDAKALVNSYHEKRDDAKVAAESALGRPETFEERRTRELEEFGIFVHWS